MVMEKYRKMNKVRIIARLDIKDEYVVKGRQLEGVRRIGNPNEIAYQYYTEGIDEILYVDNVASLYNRNNIDSVVYETTKNIFIPVTVGGGIKNVDEVRYILSRGADKVAINTAAIKNEQIIKEVAETFGSQCMVLSIQAKRMGNGKWEALYDNGREHSNKDVVEWAMQGERLGAGEILLTSVDNDGMMTGVDLELIESVASHVNIPIIACGGARDYKDVLNVAELGVSGIAFGSALHYEKTSVQKIKEDVINHGGNVRIR